MAIYTVLVLCRFSLPNSFYLSDLVRIGTSTFRRLSKYHFYVDVVTFHSAKMPGSLLRVPAYLIQEGYDAESDPDDSSYAPENDSLDDEVPSTSTAQQPPPSKRRKVIKIARKWKKADLTAQPVARRVTQPPKDFFTKIRTPTEILELFLDDEVVELIVTYSNL